MNEQFYKKGTYYFKHLNTYNGTDIYVKGNILVLASVPVETRKWIYEQKS